MPRGELQLKLDPSDSDAARAGSPGADREKKNAPAALLFPGMRSGDEGRKKKKEKKKKAKVVFDFSGNRLPLVSASDNRQIHFFRPSAQDSPPAAASPLSFGSDEVDLRGVGRRDYCSRAEFFDGTKQRGKVEEEEDLAQMGQRVNRGSPRPSPPLFRVRIGPEIGK